jgi:hypothetical protein
MIAKALKIAHRYTQVDTDEKYLENHLCPSVSICGPIKRRAYV